MAFAGGIRSVAVREYITRMVAGMNSYKAKE
jgi:hypothetical protein